MKMRKLVVLTFFTCFTTLHAQKMNIKKMPVLFGCEQFSTNDELVKCFNATIGQAIGNEIQYFSNISDYLHTKSTISKMRFKVDMEGKLTDVNVDGNNPIFNSFVWSSIIVIQNKIDQLNLKIEPAINDKNEVMPTYMSIPVRFESQVDPKVYDDFPAFERVLFTIDFEDEIIEIRINNDNVIRTIGIDNNGREFYLGKYNNLFELAIVEPYAAKIQESFSSGTTFITKGNIDGKEYVIKMKNFFSNKVDDDFLIEVIREENDSWAEYYAYKTKKEFNESKFANLTYR